MTTATARTTGDLEEFRVELTGYAYRLLGSPFDAEDAVQETLLRAWRGLDRFDGRSSLRTWLYRILTNVCLDQLRGRGRRALPMDLGAPAAPVAASLGEPGPVGDWLEPIPDAAVLPGDPAELAVARESVRLAFVAALQHLPPRQRAVLILRDVLRWHADEVAELLGASVAAVNSALQRARATLADVPEAGRPAGADLDDEHRDLLDRYVDTFARYDIDALVALLREDAVQSMPPYPMWLRGAVDIGQWLVGPGADCRGSRLVPIAANGGPAVAQYRPDPDGGHRAFSIQLLEFSGGRISRLTHFLQPGLFPRFGLPLRLDP
ncbi:sigma-70 family RNA polymerase sigma factor [Micromonospora sp. 4G57]|uniref:Sigma-70 family RNA polymerase sigma factor n=1 Tax=Micromonospora sicca TaxID=2202420 RepID=A0ABU5J895_9ACTN|nr:MULTISPECIES: sigma-70 family RNA polymerase sigma factor [unclassified Micromonospora]MDZ5442651.1 sigma-70 family RNA polymerase sigma factor [Micromonospora sp. 4G57]MDZ5488768.1 sigma-70 family RNA polymerase sigma factor [Micromonospora sp. 4G53]